MEYFKSGLKSVLGTPQEGSQPTGAETVERLVDRVQSSTLLDDRRDACRALKALSRKFRIEVGAQGMGALCQVLEMDRRDCEIVGYALDTLCNITAPESFEDEEHTSLSLSSVGNIGEQFTEIFIKQPDNVGLVLGFLEEYDFHVRWPAVKLLTSLLDNRPKEIQEIILASPMGVSKLMELLGDSREVIRNDALLLLVQLTKGNANIQKIVAFQSAFDRLFDVISEEGYSDGGIVVEDCLLLMLNLLRNNNSNQNFFKEGSYIQRLAPMFNLPPESDDTGWSAQKVSNILCMLQVVRTLVPPGNPAQLTMSSQKTMKACGLLETLCNILMASGVPADVLTETINTVAEVIRGNQGNQEYFANVMAPSNPPRPAVVVLLMSMVNEKQPFGLRCSVLYCFQCFLFKNEIGQSQLVQTLLPSSTEVVSLTTGQLLCGGLFSGEALSNWFSAVALSYALVENPAQKEQLLRVLLATSIGNQPISLMHQCTMLLLQQGNKVQSKLGLLMLLSTWLAHCPLAVKQFLSIPTSIPYLTAQAGSNEHDDNEKLVQGMCAFLMGICVTFNDDTVTTFSKEKLRQLVEKRLGLETFLDKISEVSKHELYSKAAKHPQFQAKQSSELLLDHEFCCLFKALEGMVIKAVTPKPQGDLVNGSSELSMSPSENSLLLQYKDLIREQDRKLQELTQIIDRLTAEKSTLQAQVDDLTSTISQLRDENMVLRAQTNTGLGQTTDGSTLGHKSWAKSHQLKTDSECKDSLTCKLEEQVTSGTMSDLEARLRSTTMDGTVSTSDTEKELRETQQRLAAAEEKLAELESADSELQKLRKDQEDLLELLTDQDTRLNQLKAQLRALGEKVDDDDEDLEEEGEGYEDEDSA
ncbi:General vesicular transport factor p115 [Cryptotermes secundus]|uniref:General vesicular transport factor p115 n=1 Tax=Cryptotermes secundus TaxID=105785 RepID=A0A2J7QHE7_9NEOP|nr:general vesicular transport factor p115 [Cryptotermes secundus]XP_023713205.1 general vesicular transport factor p115 [Cryptotermes secundus]XP_033608596.1 general vesicular transport factor p115 [Cryptotermes secundus]PNF28010.1 General vesicular transport factor p115 [Cryptotermes secundus]PNF28011.1 General vesicular transport factor p115 [Cryptotermes secundus]